MTEDAAGPLTEVVSKEEEAPLVAEKVKVLCWIMTGPKTHQTKVKARFHQRWTSRVSNVACSIYRPDT